MKARAGEDLYWDVLVLRGAQRKRAVVRRAGYHAGVSTVSGFVWSASACSGPVFGGKVEGASLMLSGPASTGSGHTVADGRAYTRQAYVILHCFLHASSS